MFNTTYDAFPSVGGSNPDSNKEIAAIYYLHNYLGSVLSRKPNVQKDETCLFSNPVRKTRADALGCLEGGECLEPNIH